jgi:chromosome segregation ATPase
MRGSLTDLLALLLISGGAIAQTAPGDAQVTQSLLVEIRQLRNDLQNAAVTINRVQIVMFHLQFETYALDRATQRLDQARAACSQAEMQGKMSKSRIEEAEAARGSQNPSDQKAAEQYLANLKSNLEMSDAEEQQCQVERADAENQFRTEQAKVNDLEEQLDKLDKALAGYASK